MSAKLWSTLILAAVLCLPLASVQAGSEAEVQKAGQELLRAYRDGDIPSILSFYTRDVEILGVYREPLIGRYDLEKHLEDIMDYGLNHFEVTTWEYIPNGDLMIEIGMTIAYKAGRQEVSRSRYMTVWKKQDGQWRIHRGISNQ